MSDYTIYESEQELREHLNELEDLMSDYDKTQEVLDEQRGVLVDQVQRALTTYENQHEAYELKRNDLDRRQKELSADRAAARENQEILQLQLDKKLGKSTRDGVTKKPGGNDQGTAHTEGVNQTPEPTLQEQIDRLKSQLSKPQPALNLEPPGMGNSQASAIDKDLKLMAKIKAKERELQQELKETQKLEGASEKVADTPNRSKGPKH